MLINQQRFKHKLITIELIYYFKSISHYIPLNCWLLTHTLSKPKSQQSNTNDQTYLRLSRFGRIIKSVDSTKIGIKEEILTLYVHIHLFILFWLRKISMSAKTYPLTFCVLLIHHFIFSVRVFHFYSYFLVTYTSVLSVSTRSKSVDRLDLWYICMYGQNYLINF